MFKKSCALFYLFLSTLIVQLAADSSKGFFVDAAALYWQAEQGGLGYAALASTSGVPIKGSVKNPSFDWDVGFKVGIGYQVPHDNWAVLLHFTSLQTHTDAENKANHDEVLLPTWLFSNDHLSPFVDKATMHWRLHLGLLDALIRKTYFPSDTISLRPAIGIRTAWIRQKFNVGYFGGDLVFEEGTLMRTKNKFFGIGPYFGVRTQWNYPHGFSLFSDLAWSILYGQFYIHQDEDAVSTGEKIVGIHNIFHQSVSIAQLALGLLWKHAFKGTLKTLELGIAWDLSLFFSQNQLIRFVDPASSKNFVSNQGDLSVTGGEFSLGFCF